MEMWVINADRDMFMRYAYVCVSDSVSSTGSMDSGSCMLRNTMTKHTIASLSVTSVVGGCRLRQHLIPSALAALVEICIK